MGSIISTGLEIVIKVVDAVPVLKGFRTAIVLGIMLVLFVLDKTGVGPGNLYDVSSVILWPLAVATGIAHSTVK